MLETIVMKSYKRKDFRKQNSSKFKTKSRWNASTNLGTKILNSKNVKLKEDFKKNSIKSKNIFKNEKVKSSEFKLNSTETSGVRLAIRSLIDDLMSSAEVSAARDIPDNHDESTSQKKLSQKMKDLATKEKMLELHNTRIQRELQIMRYKKKIMFLEKTELKLKQDAQFKYDQIVAKVEKEFTQTCQNVLKKHKNTMANLEACESKIVNQMSVLKSLLQETQSKKEMQQQSFEKCVAILKQEKDAMLSQYHRKLKEHIKLELKKMINSIKDKNALVA